MIRKNTWPRKLWWETSSSQDKVLPYDSPVKHLYDCPGIKCIFGTLHSEVHPRCCLCVSEPDGMQEEITVELWVQPVCSDGSWVKVELCVLFFRAEQLQCSCCCQCSAVSTSSGAKSCYFPQLCPFQWNLLVQDILHCLCSWSYNDYQGQCKGNVNLCNFSLDMPCPSSSASGCSSMGHYPISSAHFLCNEKVQIW